MLGAIAVAGCGSDPAAPDAGPTPLCNDGMDNDGDALADFPADPGCDSELDDSENNAPIAMCSDDRDNDGDGKIDYPDDPGCFHPLQNTEIDDCPDGPSCPVCANGDDDDGDGQIDFPNDSGCAAASGDDEYITNPAACGSGLVVQPIMDEASGTLQSGGTSELQGSCGGIGDEVAYELRILTPTVVVATTDTDNTMVNTVLYIRSDCMDATSEIVCNEDIDGTNQQSTVTADLAPGIYYLIVDNHNLVSAGDFELKVESFAGSGSPCTVNEDCFGELECRVPHGGTEMVCLGPICDDGYDDDDDGTADYPGDPGCATPDDTDETDDCPTGPNCPACSNDSDDDGDLLIDYPDDPQCISASGVSESCADADGVIAITAVPYAGDTTDASDDYDFACTSSTTNGGHDLIHAIDLPPTTTVTITSEPNSFDAAVTLLDSTCGGTPLACNDTPESVTQTNLPAGRYYFVVDAFGAATGTYSVGVSGTIVNGASCESPLAQSGALSCAAGYACQGTVGSRTCETAQCNDAVDADGDGFPGFPTDPGCTSSSDDDETDDCPSGASCPACGNAVDDDSDGDTDYPADADCASASQDTESCSTENDPILQLTTGSVAGDNTGYSNDFALTCGNVGGADQVYLVDLPPIESITFDTETSTIDTVLALYDSTCGTSLGCDDDGGTTGAASLLTLTNLAAGTYALVVAHYGTNTGGPYVLHASGTIAAGGRCDGPLATAGALTCGTGLTCDGTGVCIGALACNNGVDDDGDGFPGYPDDPGCSSSTDTDETDDCPSGAGCPACGNGLDDDGDGDTDYPDDADCSSAAGTHEVCAPEHDAILPLTMATVTGDNTGYANDFALTCGFNGGADQVYMVDLPTIASITFDTETSTIDTVLALYDSTCGASLGCDDDGGATGNASLLTMTGLAAGTYALVVAHYGTNTGGPYVLHTTGTIASGGRCDGLLAASGALTCDAGLTCTAGLCQ